jgi:hypothetical protein
MEEVPMGGVLRNSGWLPALFLISLFAFFPSQAAADGPILSPWMQVYSNYSYNISAYEDFDSRYLDNDDNAFDLTRVWVGLDAKMTDHWSGRVVLAGTRIEKLSTETVSVPTGAEDDPATPDVDESAAEVVSAVNGGRTGEYGAWVTYAFFTYRPFAGLGVDFGMIPNAYNTQIYKYWRYNYVQFPTLFVHRMTRSVYGDLGGALFGDLPSGYGGYRFAVLNGEGKKRSEVNSGKAFEAQMHINPLNMVDAMKGLALMGFVRYDKETVDYPELTHLLWDGLISYRYDINEKTGFSINGEFAERTTDFDSEDIDPVVSRMASGWMDFWFLKDMGVMARYDSFDPNIENDEDTGAGYQDEEGHLIAGFFFNPIKQIHLCLNYRSISYTAEIMDDQGDMVTMQPDQFVFLNTEFKVK